MYMGIFEKNMVLLEQRYHKVAEKIKEIDIDQIKEVGIQQTDSGENVLYLKREKRNWFLNSHWNPQRAAEIYAGRYEIRMYEVYFMFGFSDGKHIRELRKKCDDTNRIVVCEPNMKTFALACHLYDLRDILSDDTIIIFFSELEKDFEGVIQGIVDYTRVKLLDFCILPGYDVLYHEECEIYMDGVLECMRNVMVNKATHLAFDRSLPQHMLYHMKNLIFHSNIEQLKFLLQKENLKDIPAIIVSAGPSLDKNVHLLKQAKGKAFIIAVDASVRTVIKSGVNPDMLCTVDPNSPERFFTGLNLDQICWACNQWTNPELLDKHAKHILYYGSFGKMWNETVDKELQYLIPDIPPGGSVSTEAFMLALHFGFRKIVLIGQDLAFTGGVSHTKGIEDALGDNDEYIKSRQLVDVEGMDGTMLKTDYQMWFYKLWFEKAIRMYKDEVRVIDATEGGAKIEGAEIRTLEDVINTECTRGIDFEEIEKKVLPMFSDKQQKKLLNKLEKIEENIICFENHIKDSILKEEKILTELKQADHSSAKIAEMLDEMNKLNQQIEKDPVLDYISMYAQNEEYELGDSIYADEELTPEQLVEKSLALLKGYQKGAKLFMEDFKQFILND